MDGSNKFPSWLDLLAHKDSAIAHRRNSEVMHISVQDHDAKDFGDVRKVATKLELKAGVLLR